MYSKKTRHGVISVFEEEQDIWGAVFVPDDVTRNSVIFWYDQTCDKVQGYAEENWDRLYEMQTGKADVSQCERYDSHMDEQCVNDEDDILTFICYECGAEWQEEA